MTHRLTCPQCQHVDIREEPSAEEVVVCGRCQAVIPFVGDDRRRWCELKGLATFLVLLPLLFTTAVIVYGEYVDRPWPLIHEPIAFTSLLIAVVTIIVACTALVVWQTVRTHPEFSRFPVPLGLFAVLGTIHVGVLMVLIFARSLVAAILALALAGAVHLMSARLAELRRDIVRTAVPVLVGPAGIVVASVIAVSVLLFFCVACFDW